jgi:hypothetical protein
MEKKRELAEILADFSTALESACVSLKRNLADLLNVEDKPFWDPSKITWEKAEGSKGEYEKANCVGNLDFENLVKDLQLHNGRLRREGMFYWLFEKTEQPTVGRKKVR